MKDYMVNARVYVSMSYARAMILASSTVFDHCDQFKTVPCRLSDVGGWMYASRDYSILKRA